MPITSQIKINGVSTDCPPAAASQGDQYYLAWTNGDGTISWTTISVNSAGDDYNRGPINATTLATQAGWGPALTTFDGKVWMAYLETPESAPYIPSFPADQRRQPPVIMVSSLSGSTWSPGVPIWNPGLTGLDLYIPGIFQAAPAAISAPAIASSNSEILVVWVECAVNGSDALGVVSDGQAVTPGEVQIFFSTFSNEDWSPRKSIRGAATQATPALAATPNGQFYMAWRGASDDKIWFATYTTTDEWSEPVFITSVGTSAEPALAVDDSGNVQLVWKGESDNHLYLATQAPGSNDWYPLFQMPVVETAVQPALTFSSTLGVLLAFSGATSHDLYVVPLSTVGAVLPVPSGGADNYLIANYNNNDPLQNMTVTVVMNQDLVNISDSKADNDTLGFTFQLDCEPALDSDCSWQQYGIQVDGTSLFCWYENDPITGPMGKTINSPTLFTLPKPNTIPKGYKIEMTLVTDHSHNVTGLNVNAWDNGNPIVGGGGATPVRGPWSLPITGVEATYLSPILNLQFNIGGNGCGEFANFQSGSIGAVSYEADGPLMVLISDPDAIPRFTAESANISFDPLALYPPNPIVQNFYAS